ncbi:MAG: hypothetical protein ACI3VP_08900, partial [Oscillospiraceae bacterium]
MEGFPWQRQKKLSCISGLSGEAENAFTRTSSKKARIRRSGLAAVEKLLWSFSATGRGLLRARAVRQKRTACTLAGRSVFFPTYTPPGKMIDMSFAPA